jgi:type IV pilus assembly protein PilO
MALKIDLKSLPLYAKIIIAVLPSAIIAALVFSLVISPKMKEIKKFEATIDKQNNEIAASEAKAAKLEVLKLENERLVARISELKEQLPEEKEISNLLKQVSDLGIASGLEIKAWKPAQKTVHASGIVYEIPVSVDVAGTYHNLGNFLSSLTRLNRIVNISDMKLGNPKRLKGESTLQVSFRASTFSAIPEAEIAKPAAGKK